jgi:hypothetical protein
LWGDSFGSLLGTTVGLLCLFYILSFRQRSTAVNA